MCTEYKYGYKNALILNGKMFVKNIHQMSTEYKKQLKRYVEMAKMAKSKYFNILQYLVKNMIIHCIGLQGESNRMINGLKRSSVLKIQPT